MATVKLRFRRSTVAGKEGTLYFRITHGRVSRQINTGCRISADEWDEGRLKLPDADVQQERRSYLLSIEERIKRDAARISGIIRQLDLSGTEYTAAQVVSAFLSADGGGGEVSSFVRSLSESLKRIGKERLSETYTTTVNSFLRFCGGHGDLRFSEIRPELIREYEAWLNEQGLVPNTTSFYMRNLRAIYNRAVEQGLTADLSPFRHVYTGIGKTVKRAVPVQVIRRIKNLDLSSDHALQRSRDFFMFSFYTRGMPFVDMACLKKTDLSNGVLAYRRKKNRPTALHKVGKAHAGHCRPIPRRQLALPSADNNNARQGRAAAIPERHPPGKPPSARHRRHGRKPNPAHHQRRAPLLGKHRQEPQHPNLHHQRSNGTRFRKHYAHLSRLARHLSR